MAESRDDLHYIVDQYGRACDIMRLKMKLYNGKMLVIKRMREGKSEQGLNARYR